MQTKQEIQLENKIKLSTCVQKWFY